jgi:RNA polymerase-binding protein DksA
MERPVVEVTNFVELYERLKREKARLTQEVEQIKAQAQSPTERREGSPFGKREEEATEAFEFERRLALGKRLADTLADVEYALQKYEAGNYGLCDNCGQPIELARLEALPQARLCLSCKARQMRHAKGKLAS